MLVLTAFLVGFVLSVPPTGPVALLVLRHLLRDLPGRAVRVGLGTTVADVPYAALGALGYGTLVASRPALAAGLDLLGAAVLLVVVVQLLRGPVDPPPEDEPPAWGDLATGFLLGAANPTRLVSWSIAASFGPEGLAEGTRFVPWALAAGAGEIAWWAALAVLWRAAGPRALATRTWLLRASAALGLGLAVHLAVRAARVLVAIA